jgi:nitrite reductase/ring-hydroxylating ferredoxin subunit
MDKLQRDGVDPADMVDVAGGTVSAQVFVDRQIYEGEVTKVFPRSWLYLAHESQFKRPGDFITTYMGEDGVIVVKQSNGRIGAFLNSCAHRGASICKADLGNTSVFVCPYHGWSYSTTGELRGMPNQSITYPDLDKAKWGLSPVPRVESYKGLVFGCFDEAAPLLRDYLGDMAWYLDALVDRQEGGIEVVGGVHKIRVVGNWKLAAEQFAGDSYHTITTHSSVPGSWRDPKRAKTSYSVSDFFAQPGRQFSCRGGHGLSGFTGAVPVQSKGGTATGYSGKAVSPDFQIVADYFTSTMDAAGKRLGLQAGHAPPDGSGLVFPNFAFLMGVNGCSSIGVLHPRGPGVFEFWRWGVVDKNASPEVKSAMIRCLHVWPVGLGDADDGENWSSVQTRLSGPMSRQRRLNYQMSLGRESSDPVYPGTINPSIVGEYPQREFFRRWAELMGGGPVTLPRRS